MRTIRRMVPSPMYMRLPPFDQTPCYSEAGDRQTLFCSHGKTARSWAVLWPMSRRFILTASLAVVVLIALAAALTQLAGGQRPILFGGGI